MCNNTILNPLHCNKCVLDPIAAHRIAETVNNGFHKVIESMAVQAGKSSDNPGYKSR